MKAQLYKIVNTQNPTMVYVGITTQPLKQRLKKHKYQARNGLWKLPFHYYIVNENEWDIHLIKELDAETKKDLYLEEAKAITEIGTLNVNIFSVTNGKGTYLKNPNFISQLN